MSKVVLTAIGDDRAGLVSALATKVAEQGGNWLESEMARLGGKFAGIVLVELDDGADIDAFAEMLGWVDGLHVTVTPADSPGPATGTPLTIGLLGADRPGIVREVSQALAALGVNIDELATSTSEAPMAGGLLFHADATVRVPESVSSEQVRDALEALADELMVDFDFGD